MITGGNSTDPIIHGKDVATYAAVARQYIWPHSGNQTCTQQIGGNSEPASRLTRCKRCGKPTNIKIN